MKLKRGITPRELDEMVIPSLEFSGDLYEAFGTPEPTGVWFLWGNSGNGKSRALARLIKGLTPFGRVAVNALEEGASAANQRAWRAVNMREATGKVLLVKESMAEFTFRLSKRKAPRIAVIDSIQYTDLRVKNFLKLAEEYEAEGRLLIVTSHASGSAPLGSLAVAAMYHANLKIWVEGYRAFSKGRSIGPKGYLDLWPEKSAIYWGDSNNTTN